MPTHILDFHHFKMVITMFLPQQYIVALSYVALNFQFNSSLIKLSSTFHGIKSFE